MRRSIVPILLNLLLAPAAAFAFELGAKGAYWIPDFSGDFRLDNGGVRGSLVDVEDDLGVDDENFFFGEAWFQAGRHRLVVAGMRVDYTGKETLSRDIVVGGTRFVASGAVKSSLEYTMLDFAYGYDLIDLQNLLAGFSVGPIVQLKYLDGDLSVRGEGQLNGATGSVKESQSFQIPVPLVGVGVHVGILADLLEVRARGVGIGYRGDTLFEILGEASFTPLPFLEIVGGYRHFDIDVDEDDVLLDYSQSGPYVGVSLKL